VMQAKRLTVMCARDTGTFSADDPKTNGFCLISSFGG